MCVHANDDSSKMEIVNMYENAIEIKSAVYRQTLFTSVNPREEIVKKKTIESVWNAVTILII